MHTEDKIESAIAAQLLEDELEEDNPSDEAKQQLLSSIYESINSEQSD